MTTVELGRVRPLCRCGSPYRAHTYNLDAIDGDNDACNGYEPPQDWPRSAAHPIVGITAELLTTVAAIVQCRRQTCYGAWHGGTPEQIAELAAAIVTVLTANYRIEER